MKNRRTILFLLLAVVALAAAEVLLDSAGRKARHPLARTALADDALSCTSFSLMRRTAPPTVLEKADGAWRLVRPVAADVEPAVVLKLLDTLATAPVEETISDAELLKLGRSRADFALEDPPLRVCLSNESGRVTLAFGILTPSGEGVYASRDGSGAVLIVPSAALAAVDLPVERLRRRRLFTQDAGAVAAFDVRQRPGVVLSFVRDGPGWRLAADKASAKASAPLVGRFLSSLLAAEAKAFVWPTGAPGEGEGVSASLLAGYGLDSDSAVTVTLKRPGGTGASISFGKRADEGTVYALVHSGGAVVTVDAALKDMALTDAAGFSDARLLPSAAEGVASLTLSDGESVLAASRDAAGTWRLDAPISAPADAEEIAALLSRIRSLTTKDQDAAGVSVTVGEGAKAVSVARAALFPDGGGFERLRAREVVDIPANEIRRLVSHSAARGDAGEAVVFSRERNAWRVESAAAGSVVSSSGVARVLKALSPLVAARVETLKSTAAGLAAFGLDRPALRLAIDLDRPEAVRRNVLVGAPAPGGGRYATVGAADAVFVIPPEAVEGLSAPLTAREAPPSEAAP